MIVWSTLYLEYFEDLVYLRVANEQCLPLRHLCVDAPNAPNVNGCGIFLGPQEDFWCAVPPCANLARQAPLLTGQLLLSLI